MSALRISFKELLWGTATEVGLNADASRGTVTLDDVDVAQLTDFLNKGMRWCWETPATGWADTVQGVTVPVTNGVANWAADLDYTEWYQVWSGDPRPFNAMVYEVLVDRDADGLHVLANDLAEVFVLYRPRTPQYTATEVDTAETYNLGDRVWNWSEAGTEDGEVYRAIDDNADGDDLNNASKWVVEPVYEFLATAVQAKARAKWLRSKQEYASAREADMEAQDLLEREWVKSGNRGTPVQQVEGSMGGTWRP